MKHLQNKVIIITGATRGIGLAIALRAAADGAKIVVLGKTDEENPKLPGTIHTAASAIEAAGGEALPIACDIRFEDQVQLSFASAIEKFGGIDILVNNASAIFRAGTEGTPMSRFDLMYGVNGRGTFLCSKTAIPHLKQSSNPHILNISPPLSLTAKWFGPHVAYTMSKYAMSMCTLGMACELKEAGIAVNSLWPVTTIATQAVKMLGGDELMNRSRKPEIMADAAYLILTKPAAQNTGNFFLDEDVLASAGIEDLEQYAFAPGHDLMPDIFVDRAAK